MEDMTNHKIYDKSIVSSNHANNFECVFSNDTVCAAYRPRDKFILGMQSYSFDN